MAHDTRLFQRKRIQILLLTSRPRFPEIDNAQVDDGPDDGVGDVDAEGNVE